MMSIRREYLVQPIVHEILGIPRVTGLVLFLLGGLLYWQGYMAAKKVYEGMAVPHTFRGELAFVESGGTATEFQHIYLVGIMLWVTGGVGLFFGFFIFAV